MPKFVRNIQMEARSVDDIVSVYVEAGKGLAAAHQKCIVHRDFKPDNVMVDRSGRVLVMDFGMLDVAEISIDLYVGKLDLAMARTEQTARLTGRSSCTKNRSWVTWRPSAWKPSM